jgi:hypothetical protein
LQIAPGILIRAPKSYAVITLRQDEMLGSIAKQTAKFKSFAFVLFLFFMF